MKPSTHIDFSKTALGKGIIDTFIKDGPDAAKKFAEKFVRDKFNKLMKKHKRRTT